MPESNRDPDTPASPSATTASACDGVYLAFDFGERRIGVASGNSVTCTSMPLTTVDNREDTPNWQALDALVKEWRPVGLVVGRPLHMDGTEQPMTRLADRFRRILARRYELPVYPADERQSSRYAREILKENRQLRARGRIRRHDIDKTAAAVLLRQWLEARSNECDDTT